MNQDLLKQLRLDNQFIRLGSGYSSVVTPNPPEEPRLVGFNQAAASLIGIDAEMAQQPDFLRYFSGQVQIPGSDPIAMCYSGHQFGHYVSELGDGRAILLAQVRDRHNESWDLQLKGAGLTPYSRDGDGRAVLRSTIREYLCGEAMHGLGIPTTRSLCLFESDEEVYREQIETGAMLVRMSPSHVRFGSFEYFYHSHQFQKLKPLADHVIHEHYPELEGQPDQYLQWLSQVIHRTARMIAQWQSVGFSHGVMNTDNMSVLGLTLDYGPYGFLDTYDPGYICNHSDHSGRYAFNQQPSVGLWNLSCFAQAILPLLSDEPEEAGQQAISQLDQYHDIYRQEFLSLMRLKIGLKESDAVDQPLIDRLLKLLSTNQVDYSIFFRSLSTFLPEDQTSVLRDQFVDREAFDGWAGDYRQRLLQEKRDHQERQRQMDATNPAIILRNYIAQEVIQASEAGDHQLLNSLLPVLQNPYDVPPEFERYRGLPPEWASRLSVSCSS